MMNLDLREMLGGDLARLRYIRRFSTCRTVLTESVAEHTCFVSLYCLFLTNWANANGVHVSLERVLMRAALHDVEECRTGDFPRDFKYSTPELTKAINNAALGQFRGVVCGITDDTEHTESVVTEWINAKDESPEGCIVELADFLSALAFICEEKKVGNFCLSQHTGTLTQYLSKFEQHVRYAFLLPIVRQAKRMVTEVLA